jgi:hypothetical protein
MLALSHTIAAMADGENDAEILDAKAPRAITSGTVRVTPDGTGAWAAVFTAKSGRPDVLVPGQDCRLRLDGQEAWRAVVESSDRTTVRLLSPPA